MNTFKKIFAVLVTVLAVMLMSTAVFAYTGRGTEDDPYIITDYAEFAQLSQSKIGYTKFTYYKLGADISSEDSMNETMLITIGEERDRASYMYLDLNGHNIFRKAKTTDKGLFVVNSGKLIIEDSVGTGMINSYMTDGTNYAPVFYVNYMYPNMDLSASLTINGGTYNDRYTHLPCIVAGNTNGDLTINNGVFCSAVIINNYNICIGVPTNFYVNGGNFKQINSSDSVGETCIRDCTISESLVTSNKFLNDVIYSSSVVTQNGTVLTTLPKQELTGNIVITDPNKSIFLAFNENGGKGTIASQTLIKGHSIILPECTLTPPDNAGFYKWRIDGVLYDAGDEVTINKDSVAYATWYVKKVKKRVMAPVIGATPVNDAWNDTVLKNGEEVNFEDYTTVMWSHYGTFADILTTPFAINHTYQTYIYESVNRDDYYYTDDTEYYINGELATLDSNYSSSKTAAVTYIFPKLTYESLTFDDTKSSYTVGGKIFLDNVAYYEIVEGLAEESEEAMMAYFDGDYHVEWYAGSELIYTGTSDSDTSFTVTADCAGRCVYAVLILGDQTAKSVEVSIPDNYKYTGLKKADDGNWYYYVDGEIDTTRTGIVGNDAGYWYVENGKLNFNFSGVVSDGGIEYVVKYGYMSTGFYGLVKKSDGTWGYAEAGVLTYAYTGLAKNDVGWWYITDGVIDFTYTGIGTNATGSYRVVNGLIDFTFNGWFNANGLWWYMKGGMVDTTKAGLVKKDSAYYYVENGEINFKFTGLAENAGNTYYVKWGYLDFSFSGEVVVDGKTYTVVKGIVQ